MNLTINLIYNLPNRKTYYKLISYIGNYESEPYKRYCFHWFNKFGSGVMWRDSEFADRLKPSTKQVQLLFGLK